MGRVFINYAREDVAVARKLYHDLKQAGADPWLDSEDLLPGQDWELEIKRAVKGSTYFIALISSHSVGKQGFVQKEIRFALDVLDELPPGKVYVIPTRLDDSTPSHERLSKIHWVDLFPSYDAGLAKIKESVGIAKRKTERAKPEAASQHEKRSPIGPDVPDNVAEIIRSKAERDFPDDFQTRRYQIDTELKAWRRLQVFQAPEVPDNVLTVISERATHDFPDDYSTRLYQMNNEVQAWRELQAIKVEGVPQDVLDSIVAKATRDFPDDFSTRLYQIRNEAQAWGELYKGD